MTRAIDHITLDTGHVRRSPRHEVGAEALAAMRDSLADTLAHPHERTPLPAMAGYSYSASAEDGSLMVTIWGTLHPAVGPPSIGPAPVVTFGVARAGGDAAGLWRLLHGARGGMAAAPYVTRVDQAPPAPWLAARLEAGSTLIPAGDLLWMADFERVTAWAWLEMDQ